MISPTNSPLKLSELKPEDGWAQVLGFSKEGPLKELLMSFGLYPGVRLSCAAWVPGSRSQILQFESWQGVLRPDEAEIVQIELTS